ncbi:hypothetical protein [Microbacterium sp. NPDC056234]|uniref:hypothetical protein n=1 Tax=Microbacterium sp. NPDC056234 TaxID=3345757 RepID=UPI0035DA3B24
MEPTRSERADAFTVLLYGLGAAVVVGIGTWLRGAAVFRDDGIAWVIPIDEQPIDATAESGAIAVEGIAQEALIFATDMSAGAVAAIIGSIALWALTALVVISAVMLVAFNFLRGRVFVPGNAWAFTIMGWVLSLAPLVIVALDNVARNGVLAAAGFGEGETVHPIEFWAAIPVVAGGIAVGLISVAFRRGIRLQKETEGLV